MRFKLFILLAVSFVLSNKLHAQSQGNLEGSINLGLASFQTDYGERGDIRSSLTGNIGFAVGGSLYLNFFNKDPLYGSDPNWSQRHLKLKLEGSYLRANLEHFIDTDVRKYMKGRASVINFGGILEYHPFVIPDYIPEKERKTSPYLGIGVMGGYSMPTEKDSGLLQAYQPYTDKDGEAQIPVITDSFFTYSLVLSTGIRYKLDDASAIMLDMRWQYFDSDYIDGLSPNPALVKNIHNDWLYYLNVGYVINFGSESRGTTWWFRKHRR